MKLNTNKISVLVNAGGAIRGKKIPSSKSFGNVSQSWIFRHIGLASCYSRNGKSSGNTEAHSSWPSSPQLPLSLFLVGTCRFFCRCPCHRSPSLPLIGYFKHHNSSIWPFKSPFLSTWLSPFITSMNQLYLSFHVLLIYKRISFSSLLLSVYLKMTLWHEKWPGRL